MTSYSFVALAYTGEEGDWARHEMRLEQEAETRTDAMHLAFDRAVAELFPESQGYGLHRVEDADTGFGTGYLPPDDPLYAGNPLESAVVFGTGELHHRRQADSFQVEDLRRRALERQGEM